MGNAIIVLSIGYFLALLAIGYYGYRQTRSQLDYSLMGRRLTTPLAVFLYVGAFISSGTYIAFAGTVYTMGWTFLMFFGIAFGLALTLMQIMSTRFYSAEWETTPDLYGDRYYSEFLRGFISFFVTGWMVVYVLFALMGVGHLISGLTTLTYETAVVIMGGIFVLYVVLGGMISVVWTNVLQVLIMIIGTAAMLVFALGMTGGLTAMNTTLAEAAPHLTMPRIGGGLPWSTIIGLWVALPCSIASAVWHHRIFFSCRDRRTATSFVGPTAIFVTFIMFAVTVIALAVRVQVPDLAVPDQTMAVFLSLIPVWAAAFMLVGVLAAAMSSVDSQLLAASVQVTHDIYRRYLNPGASDDQLQRISRIWSALLGIVAILLAAADLATMIEVYDFFVRVTAVVLFPPLFLGLFWRRTTREAAIAGTLVGLIGGLYWYLAPPLPLDPTLTVMPVVFLVMVVVSLLTPRPPEHVIHKFFTERARAVSTPVAGND